MNLNFNKRKWWRFGKRSVCLEVSGFRNNPSIGFSVDGDEGHVTFNLTFFFGLWLTFEQFLPQRLYPKYKSDTYGDLPGEREVAIRFHNGTFWWTLWNDPDFWGKNSWRWGHIDFLELLKGKTIYEGKELERELHIISMIEGNYEVEVIKELKIHRFQRWFTKRYVRYEVRVGYYEGDKFIEMGVPIDGKGENSWDQGEDATFSSSFAANTKDRSINSCEEAAWYFCNQMKRDRRRRSSLKWLPERFSKEGIKLIKKINPNPL